VITWPKQASVKANSAAPRKWVAAA